VGNAHWRILTITSTLFFKVALMSILRLYFYSENPRPGHDHVPVGDGVEMGYIHSKKQIYSHFRGNESVDRRGNESVDLRGNYSVDLRGNESVNLRGNELFYLPGNKSGDLRENKSVDLYLQDKKS